jgi:hypothetical protein
MFGEPNTGIHSYRIFGIAFFDLLMTIIASIILGKYQKVKWYYILVVLLIVGEILHIYFCVKTPITKLLGY